MTSGLKLIAACAVLSVTTPALADSTYVGRFKGVVTSGSYSLYYPSGACGCNGSTDLTGQTINLIFSAHLFDKHVNAFGDPMSNYMVITYSGIGQTFSFSGSASNESLLYPYPLYLYETADFAGDAINGSVATQSSSFYSDWGYAFNLSYSGAGATSGPLTGSGSASSYDIYSWPEKYFSVNFNLTSGSVQAVPEPSTWTLMILGFGFIGVAMRRRAPSRISYT